MNNRVSVLSFRAIVPAATVPGAPVEVKLKPICPALVELQMWCTTVPALATSGFRMFTRKTQVIPDTGSEETGLTATAYAADWAPLPNTRFQVALFDRMIDGPAFEVMLQFYSTAAIEVGGLLVARDPRYGIHDLVMQMGGLVEKLDRRRDEA